jgi:hypothetical protein
VTATASRSTAMAALEDTVALIGLAGGVCVATAGA